MPKIRLVSWNVNGIRANIKKGFWQNIDSLNPDIISVQETKSDEQIMLTGVANHPRYNLIFHSASSRKGYSGVATMSKVKEINPVIDSVNSTEKERTTTKNEGFFAPSSNSSKKEKLELVNYQIGLGIPEFDVEGRLVIAKYKVLNTNLDFTLLNGYFPQGGRGPHRIDYKIRFYQAVYDLANKLRQNGEKIIICGDLNTTVADIDLARPNENRNTTGCLPEEREAMDLFLKNDFVDSFRYFYPELAEKYTYWDQITRARERNTGWRIDYFLLDKALIENLKQANIHDKVMGSDHCPISIDLEFN